MGWDAKIALESRWREYAAERTAVAENGCLNWTGVRDRDGYGKVALKVDGVWRFARAHRVAVFAAGREIAEGGVVDHLCRNRACVNPDHLDVVSPRENSERGNHPNVRAHLAGRCTRGHRVAGANARKRSSGGVRCRQCHAERQREWYERRRAS